MIHGQVIFILFYRYDFTLDKWDEIKPNTKIGPEPRYGHSLSLHKGVSPWLYKPSVVIQNERGYTK